MSDHPKDPSRRRFLKTAGAAGLASILPPALNAAAENEAEDTEVEKVPMRPFGNSGIKVPILSLGGMFNISNNQIMLHQAVRWGVTYWDTANSYGGGDSEEGIGKYFNRFPDQRKDIFLVTKSGRRDETGMRRHLELSLKRMNTDYVDLFFVHGIRRISQMTDDARRFAERAKAEGKIRLFGFSTHSNMEELLLDAPSLGYVDGIMMTYNFRNMNTDAMRRGVDACAKAGIGLTAMKTMAGGPVKASPGAELDFVGKFLQKGYSSAQAKLKAVWENQQISAICSQMPSMVILMANIGAAVNRAKLSARDFDHLDRFAQNTAGCYCAGCATLCESALTAEAPVADVMRFLMYKRDYGEADLARTEFARLPEACRQSLAALDFSPAERRCPRNLPIARLMKEALVELA